MSNPSKNKSHNCDIIFHLSVVGEVCWHRVETQIKALNEPQILIDAFSNLQIVIKLD